jgi:hypothetical protein
MVACPETGIITGERLTKACGEDNSDAAAAGQFLADQAARGGRECKWYGDSAYGTGELRAAIGQAGHTAVIKPGPLKPAVDGGFTTDDFTVDEKAGTATCPAGHRPPQRHLRRSLPRLPAARPVHYRQRRANLAAASPRCDLAGRPGGLGRRARPA